MDRKEQGVEKKKKKKQMKNKKQSGCLDRQKPNFLKQKIQQIIHGVYL